MLYVRYISPLDDGLEKRVEVAVQEFNNFGVTFCGFDSEMTVTSAMKTALLGNAELVVPSIVQFAVKGKIEKADYSFPMDSPVREDYSAFVFPVKAMISKGHTMPNSFIQLLKNDRLVKASVGVINDLNIIGRALGFQIAATLELQHLAAIVGYPGLSLKDLANHFVGIPKIESAGGNYDGVLDEEQIKYSAMDAALSLMIVESIMGSSIVDRKDEKTIALTDKDYKNMWNFLLRQTSNFAGSKNLTEQKVFNQLYTSYGDWKTKYSVNVITEAVKNFLDWLYNEGYITKTTDDAGEEIIVPKGRTIVPSNKISTKTSKISVNESDPASVSTVVLALAKQVLEGKGLARSSLLNYLKNNINLSNTDNAKTKLLQSALDNLVSSGQLDFDDSTMKYHKAL